MLSNRLMYNDDKYIMNKANKITLPVIALTSDKA
jgi:hypothetical protein